MPSSPLKRQTYPVQRLTSLAKAEEFIDAREPPLRLGDIVRLNSGGPAMMVVDIGTSITVALSNEGAEGGIVELNFPAPCVHRKRNLV